MAEERLTKILEIQLDYKKAVEGIATYERQILKAKEQQEQWRSELKELNKAFKDGDIGLADYEKAQTKLTEKMANQKIAIKQLKDEQAALTKHVQQEVKIENSQADSLVALRAKLSNLTAEYDNLSGEMRNGSVGQALQAQINSVTDEIKGAEESTQRFYRNVGNYANSIVKANQMMSEEVTKLKEEYDNAAAAADAAFDAAEKAGKDAEEAAKREKELAQSAAEAQANLTRTIEEYGESSEQAHMAGAALTDVNKQLEEATEATREASRQFEEATKTAKDLGEEAADAFTKWENGQASIDFFGEAVNKASGSLKSFIPFGDQIAKLLPLIGSGASGVKQAFSLAGQGAQMLGKQLMALMANPIVAFLGLLAAAITIVINGIKGSEENMNQWNKIMAPVTRALTGMRNVIEILCGWILNLVEFGGRLLFVLGNIVEWATSSIPIVGDAVHNAMEATREAIDLEEREQKLTKDRRKAIVEEAKMQQEIAKLRNDAADASNKDTEARLAANKKAMDLELQMANERKRMAKEELEIAKEKAAQAGNSAADNEELARLEAAVYQAETEYFKNTKRMQTEQNALEKSIADERKKRADDAKKQYDERAKAAADAAKKEEAAIRTAEDALLSLVKDSTERRRQQIQTNYAREIEDLRKRLEEEKNLTEKAREAIRQTIEAKERQQADALADLEAQISEEAIQRKQKETQLMLDAVKAGTDQEYQLKLQQNQLNLEADLAATEREIENIEEREKMKELIRAKYAAQEEQLNQERQQAINERELEAIQNEFEERLMAAQDNSYQQAQIELEQREQELNSLHQMETESNEQFRARELAAIKAFNDAKKKVTQTENQIQQSRLEVAKSVTGGIADAFAALGESNKAFAKMSKILAIAEIAINTGKAIASGIAQSQSVPYPANLAAIASTIAAVLSGITSAVSAVNSAKFARGGKVTGAGTGTSDSIPAMLSNGEFVMTAAATKIFEPELRAMNEIGRGVNPQVSQSMSMSGASPDLFKDSLTASVSEIKPVVSVVDINDGQSRVEVIDTLDTL